MNEVEFLIDTINHYTSLNRNVAWYGDSRICVYMPANDTSKGCAVGRHLLGFKGINDEDNISDFGTFVHVHPELVPDWLRLFDVNFVLQVQQLHDSEEAWNNRGISDHGVVKVRDICRKFFIDFERLVVSCPRLKYHNDARQDA